MVRHRGGQQDNDADTAAWEAAGGAATGAVKWGLAAAVLGLAGYAISPLYRGLTIQFKVYIQMSGMVMGGMIEADRRIRDYEATVRLQRRMKLDRANWDKYENEYQEAPSTKENK